MAYNVGQVKTDIIGMLHGTTSNQIAGFNNLIYRAARRVLRDCDPQETKRIMEFTNPIYSQVYDYPIPVDLKGNKIIDIFPSVQRLPTQVANQDYNQQFDLNKLWSLANQFTLQFNSGVKTIRLLWQALPAPISFNLASEVSQNGTWVVGGDATNLQQNNVNYIAGGSSLSFDVTGATGIAYLENSTMTALNLSDQVLQGAEFFYSFLPTASNFTSINLRWGSSASNYWTRTMTVNQNNTVFQNGWNLMQANWSGLTAVGSPVATAMNYLRVTWNYTPTTTMNGVLLNNITSQLGSILNISYYSKYLFRDAITGAFQETVTDDSNLINLDTESYDLLTYCAAWMAVQQQQGMNALKYDGPWTEKNYMDALTRYMQMYKSEVQKPGQPYYKMPNNNYGQWVNIRYGN